MDFPTHLRIGGLLYTWIQQTYLVRLHKAAFLYGCIEPDYEHLFEAAKNLKGHHCYEDSLKDVLKMYEDLPPVGGDRFSFQLGRLCHYLMDFSCFPHTEMSNMSPLAHILYEKQMGMEAILFSRKLFYKSLDELPACNSRAVPDMIQYIHEKYRQYCQFGKKGRQMQMAYDVSFACISCATVIAAYLDYCSVPVLPIEQPIKALPAAMFSIF